MTKLVLAVASLFLLRVARSSARVPHWFDVRPELAALGLGRSTRGSREPDPT